MIRIHMLQFGHHQSGHPDQRGDLRQTSAPVSCPGSAARAPCTGRTTIAVTQRPATRLTSTEYVHSQGRSCPPTAGHDRLAIPVDCTHAAVSTRLWTVTVDPDTDLHAAPAERLQLHLEPV